MDRKIILLGIVLVFFAALAYRVSQTQTPESDRLARLARIQKMMDEGRPVYAAVEEAKKARFEQRAQRLAGLIETLAAPVAKTIAEVAKKDAKKDVKDDKKKKLAKKDDKKKKKKKKKSKIDPANSDDTEIAKKDDHSDSKSGSNIGGYAGQRYSKKDPNGALTTVEEWMGYMADGDYDKATELIQAFQSGAITSEVFYGVVTKLLKENDDSFHSLAVYALGATPSTESFMRLFAVETNEKESEKVQAEASEFIVPYASFEQVRYLQGALVAQGNEAASLRALGLLTTALASAKNSQATQSGNDPDQPKNPRAPASNPARYFIPFQSTLARLAQGGGTLSTGAQEALSLLQTLAASPT